MLYFIYLFFTFMCKIFNVKCLNSMCFYLLNGGICGREEREKRELANGVVEFSGADWRGLEC